MSRLHMSDSESDSASENGDAPTLTEPVDNQDITPMLAEADSASSKLVVMGKKEISPAMRLRRMGITGT